MWSVCSLQVESSQTYDGRHVSHVPDVQGGHAQRSANAAVVDSIRAKV